MQNNSFKRLQTVTSSGAVAKSCVFLLPALTILFGVPSLAAAHVKWFVQEQPERLIQAAPFSFADPWVQIWAGIVVVCITTAVLMERYLPGPPVKLVAYAYNRKQHILHLFQVLVGLAMLVTAIKGAILAPHLSDDSILGHFLRFVQGGIGVLFIANKAIRLGALLMIILYLASTGLFGFVTSLEYFNFLGIALFLLFQSLPEHSGRPYALPLLRIHTGIALGVLALTEKLLDPTLAMYFLEKNQINFLKAINDQIFTDRFFVLSAGCTELIFASIFVLGLITRINTASLAGFLVSSNLYFFLAGKTDEAFLELSGHLPLISVAIILICYGGGNKFCLSNLLFPQTKETVSPRVSRSMAE